MMLPVPNSVIVYSVVAEFTEPSTRERYVEWLRGGHCLAMVRAGGALSAEVTVLDGGAVEARYLFASRADFDGYQSGPAVDLGAERDRHFPPDSGIRTVRTIGERAVRIPD
jgi:hypothetical protein